MIQEQAIIITAVIVAFAACVTDLRTRRIPNPLILTGLGLGLGLNFVARGWTGLGWSALGALLGLGLFLPFFALGGMGGGDVKLLAALGALLGPRDLLAVALVGAVAGGLFALAAAARRGQLVQTLRGISTLFAFWVSGGLRPSPVLNLTNPATLKIPYAVPVAAGLLVVILGRWS